MKTIIPGFQLNATVKKNSLFLCLSFTAHIEHLTSDLSSHQMLCVLLFLFFGPSTHPPHTKQCSETLAGCPIIQLNSDTIYLEILHLYTPEIQS